jgi:hypothetical protein
MIGLTSGLRGMKPSKQSSHLGLAQGKQSKSADFTFRTELA